MVAAYYDTVVESDDTVQRVPLEQPRDEGEEDHAPYVYLAQAYPVEARPGDQQQSVALDRRLVTDRQPGFDWLRVVVREGVTPDMARALREMILEHLNAPWEA